MSYQIVTDIAAKLTASLPTVQIVSNPADAEELSQISELIAVTVVGANYMKATTAYDKKITVALHVITVGATSQGACQDLVDSAMVAIKEFLANKTEAAIAFSFKSDAESPYSEAVINFTTCNN